MRYAIHSFIAGCALFGALTGSAPAASVVMESFDTGPSGWSTDDSGGWTNGTLFMQFESLGGPTPPKDSVLTASHTASGGSFTGNYLMAPLHYIGFDFIAETQLPDDLFIALSRTNLTVSNVVLDQIPTAGEWHRVLALITSQATGHWTSPGNTPLYHILSNVTSMAISVQTQPAGTEVFRIDNVVLGRFPSASTLSVSPMDNEVEIVWVDLFSNWTYQVETTDDLTSGQWTNAGSFTATDNQDLFVVPYGTNQPTRSYRLLLE